MRVITPLRICSISGALQVISELEASVRFLNPRRASVSTTWLITLSPSRKAWWNEMVMPSCSPLLRMASSRSAHSLRWCFSVASFSQGVRWLALTNRCRCLFSGYCVCSASIKLLMIPSCHCNGPLTRPVRKTVFYQPGVYPAGGYWRTPDASARSTTRRAWSIIGPSIIFPFSEMTPSPARSPSSAALMTRWA